jgi:hypothetical protein
VAESHSIGRQHQDQLLHVEFKDGEVADLKVLVVSECDEHEDCRGFTYDLIQTNRPERIKLGSAYYWAQMKDIESFRILGA